MFQKKKRFAMLLRPFCSNLLNSFLIMSVCKFLKLFYVYCAKTVEFQVFFFFLKISCNEIGLIINVFAQIIGSSGRKKSIESKT